MEKVTANKKLSEMNQIKEPKYPKSAFLTALDNFLQKVFFFSILQNFDH